MYFTLLIYCIKTRKFYLQFFYYIISYKRIKIFLILKIFEKINNKIYKFMESQKLKIIEDFPEVNLNKEDKIRIIKGLILILFFSSVCKL